MGPAAYQMANQYKNITVRTPGWVCLARWSTALPGLHASVPVSGRFEGAFPATASLRHDVTPRLLCQCKPVSRGRQNGPPHGILTVLATRRDGGSTTQKDAGLPRHRARTRKTFGSSKGGMVQRVMGWIAESPSVERGDGAGSIVKSTRQSPTRSLDRLANGPVSVSGRI